MITVRKIATYLMVGTLAFAGQTATVYASETPVAGINLVLSDLYMSGESVDLEIPALLSAATKSQDNDLAFAKVKNYVNIRSKASEKGKILGKLYKDSAATILGKKGDWYQVKSGAVTGYIKGNYLITGNKAKDFAETTGFKMAKVTTPTLRVREKASSEAPVVTLVPIGDEYKVTKEKNGWVKILVDERTSGYVSTDFVECNKVYNEAISIEEEQARLADETITLLSTKSSSSLRSTKNDSSNNSSSKISSKSSSSSNSSSLRNKIADYAVKFKGNPYVWGGTSLTKGADCSGFTQSIFEDFGIDIPRTSRSQASGGRRVSIDNIKPGDLIFYRKNGSINHVALYIGNGKVVGAKSRREGIRITDYDYRTPYKAVSYIN